MTIARRARTETDSLTGKRTYGMRTGKWPWSHRTVTPLNSLGFPDREFAGLPPKGDCVHLVFVGDSYIFGDGVDLDSSMVSFVRRRAAGTGRCTRVFNLGRRGTSIDRQAEAVLATLDALEPDIVVLGQYQNDLTDLAVPADAADSARVRETGVSGAGLVQERFTLLNPSLVRFLSYHAFGTMITRGWKKDILAGWSVVADTTRRDEAARLMAVYEAGFDSLLAALRARGVGFGTVVIPSKFDVLAGRYPEEEFFTTLAASRDVPALRTFPLLDRERSPYAFLMYDGHLNVHGNRLLADTIHAWLWEHSPAPFPRLRDARAQGIERTR